MKSLIVAALIAAGAPVAAQEASVRFYDLAVESEIGQTQLGVQAYLVTYAAENIGQQTISTLDAVIVGRNEEGQIVETTEYPIVWRRSLPNGLLPGESIVVRHAMPISIPAQRVVTIEVQVQRIDLRD